MKKNLCLSMLLSCSSVWAADLTGEWRVVDDKSGTVLAQVKVQKLKDQTYEGRVVQLFNMGEAHPDSKKFQGVVLLSNLKEHQEKEREFFDGIVFDPIERQVHRNVTAKLNNRANILMLRGKSDNSPVSRRISWVKIETP